MGQLRESTLRRLGATFDEKGLVLTKTGYVRLVVASSERSEITDFEQLGGGIFNWKTRYEWRLQKVEEVRNVVTILKPHVSLYKPCFLLIFQWTEAKNPSIRQDLLKHIEQSRPKAR